MSSLTTLLEILILFFFKKTSPGGMCLMGLQLLIIKPKTTRIYMYLNIDFKALDWYFCKSINIVSSVGNDNKESDKKYKRFISQVN